MSQIIDKLAWIEIRKGKILSTLSKGKERYYIPGGKREEKETDHEALIREIREELSVTLKPSSLRYFGTFEAQADGHTEGIRVRMTCYTADYEGQLQAASEIEKLVWLDYEDRARVSAVDQLIFDYLRKESLF